MVESNRVHTALASFAIFKNFNAFNFLHTRGKYIYIDKGIILRTRLFSLKISCNYILWTVSMQKYKKIMHLFIFIYSHTLCYFVFCTTTDLDNINPHFRKAACKRVFRASCYIHNALVTMKIKTYSGVQFVKALGVCVHAWLYEAHNMQKIKSKVPCETYVYRENLIKWEQISKFGFNFPHFPARHATCMRIRTRRCVIAKNSLKYQWIKQWITFSTFYGYTLRFLLYFKKYFIK